MADLAIIIPLDASYSTQIMTLLFIFILLYIHVGRRAKQWDLQAIYTRMTAILGLIKKMKTFIPLAYRRIWFARMMKAAEGFILQILPERLKAAIPEVVPYFQQSFGNVTRLDYGTGHETTFIAFLYCLAALGRV